MGIIKSKKNAYDCHFWIYSIKKTIKWFQIEIYLMLNIQFIQNTVIFIIKGLVSEVLLWLLQTQLEKQNIIIK